MKQLTGTLLLVVLGFAVANAQVLSDSLLIDGHYRTFHVNKHLKKYYQLLAQPDKSFLIVLR